MVYFRFKFNDELWLSRKVSLDLYFAGITPSSTCKIIQASSISAIPCLGSKRSARRKLSYINKCILALLIFKNFSSYLLSLPTYTKPIFIDPTLDILAYFHNNIAATTQLPRTSTGSPSALTEGYQGKSVGVAPAKPPSAPPIELKGTVNVPIWVSINTSFRSQDPIPGRPSPPATAMVNSSIGFGTPQLGAGDCRLRLVVADNQNKLFPPVLSRWVVGP
jgi:hypothetical protein